VTVRPWTLRPADRPHDLLAAEWAATLVVAGHDVAAREALVGILARAGYRVLEAADAAAAHEAVTSESADLLIADLTLPGDAIELCRAVKSDPLTSLLPVVHLIAEDNGRQRNAALDAGSDDVIAGPLAADELLMRVRSLLRARRATAQLVSTEAVMIALAKTVEARDLYTERHLFRVAEGAVRVATLMGLPRERVEVVRLGGLLHDLGKIGVPDRVLLKPGSLTRPEFELVRSHPLTGAEIVRPLAAFGSPERIVLHHHERFDGTGYPFGLRGEEIPLGARIVAVSDAFDAITTNRPYRPRRPAEDALAILEDGRGSQWDPAVVDAFLGLYRDPGPGIETSPNALGIGIG
jgi:putative two-component system response regulator